MAITAGVSEPKMEAHVFKWKWLAVPNGNTGSAIGAGANPNVDLAVYADKCIQVTGTFGAGGSANLEGSNDGGTTWAILTAPDGTALTFTATGLKQVVENPEQMRLNVTAGDGTTAINGYLYMRKMAV